MITLYICLILTNCAIVILAILLWRVWRELQDTQRTVGAIILGSLLSRRLEDRVRLERLYRGEEQKTAVGDSTAVFLKCTGSIKPQLRSDLDWLAAIAIHRHYKGSLKQFQLIANKVHEH